MSDNVPFPKLTQVIGKVVHIQVIPRQSDASDTLNTVKMQHHYGVLQVFIHDNAGYSFRLEGGPMINISHRKYTIEVYTNA